ncbi:hypothetical protein DH2020_006014 [Rehmannia glutinosa]|uniref:Zinc knuckle CX2CX4HX4C domain-containing protein n=1 Tax=Rehmannia glutinosa TaxID=99300 RepID=A0ABR0XHN8_REHGL
MNVETSLKVGKMFGQVMDVHIPEGGSLKGRFSKILVGVNLEKPLFRGTFINFGCEKVWVDFRYENLAGFCYYCGIVGHTEKICEARRQDLQSNNLKGGQYGEWLKANELWNKIKMDKPPSGNEKESAHKLAATPSEINISRSDVERVKGSTSESNQDQKGIMGLGSESANIKQRGISIKERAVIEGMVDDVVKNKVSPRMEGGSG